MVKFLNDTGLTRLVALIKQAINGKADKTELPLVVNFTESNNVVTCDTSIADIYAAYSAGREVFGRVSAEGQLNLTLCLPNLVTFSNAFGNSIAQVMGFVENNTDTWTNNPISLQTQLTFDSTPTLGSSRPVTSEGIKVALNAKQDTLTFDSTPTANSTNPVTSSGIKTAIDSIESDVYIVTCTQTGQDTGTTTATYSEITAAKDSGKVVFYNLGGGFYRLSSSSYPRFLAFSCGDDNKILRLIHYVTATDGHSVGDVVRDYVTFQTALTFDNAPTSGSSNPVKSGGIKTAIDAVKQMRIELTSSNNGTSYTANYTYQQILAAYHAGADLSVTIDGNGYPIYHLTNEENGYFSFMGTPHDEINCIQNLHLNTNGTWNKEESYYSQEMTSHLVVNEAPSQTVDPVGELSFGGGTPSLYLRQTQNVGCNDNSTSASGYIMKLKSDGPASGLSGDEYCPVLFRFGQVMSSKKGWFAYIPEGYTPRTQPYLSLTKDGQGLYIINSSLPIMSRATGVVGLFPRPRYSHGGIYYVPHLSKRKKLMAYRGGTPHEQKPKWGIALIKKTDYANMAKPWDNSFDFTKLATNIMPFRVSYRIEDSGWLSVSVVT